MLEDSIRSAALKSFGLRKRRDPEWYRESRALLNPIFEKKCKAMVKLKVRPTRQAVADYQAARVSAQRYGRECVHAYSNSLSTGLEDAKNLGNIKDNVEHH